jgi:hypothetical protein
MWHNIQFNANLIQYETARAVLIKLPEVTDQFWHPIKCVRFVPGSGDSLIKIGVADDMIIKTHRPGNGQYNRTIKLDEREYNAEQFIEKMRGKCGNPETAQSGPVEVGNLSELVALLVTASAHLKYPKFRVATPSGDVIVSRAGAKSKNAGWLYVKSPGGFDDSTYYGKVNPDSGVYLPSRDASPDVAEALERFAEDPAKVASDYGKLNGNCCFCVRPLSDERSTEVGYGATCAKHYALPWGA